MRFRGRAGIPRPATFSNAAVPQARMVPQITYPMFFYIVTPAYNALGWLQRCIRSVADQAGRGVQVHHHVQDGGSADGTAAWLEQWRREHADSPDYTFTYESERDKGMYDAINRAWEKMPAGAAVTAHINADEQYLPGALAGVSAAFSAQPQADIVLGTYVIVDNDQRYICHRRPITPHRWTSATVCEIITCSCFHRAESFRAHGIRFNTKYRALADVVFYREIVNHGQRYAVCPELLTTAFTVTGENLAWSETSRREWEEEQRLLPWYVTRRHGIAYRWCNLKRMLTDRRCIPPRSYSIFLGDSTARTVITINHPTCRWGCRTVSED